MDITQAIKATRNGAIAAIISAVMTIAVVVIAITSDAEGKLAIWNDPLNFLDVFIILACAVGIYRKSRVASIILFLYFISAKIIISIDTQSVSGLGVSLVFLYFYGKAIQGAFTYHKLRKEEDPDYKATSTLTYIIATPSVLIVAVLMGFALMSTTGVIPSTRVQAANEIPGSDMATLLEQGIVYRDEHIKYFYSQGFTSILESGNILTDRRVILYFTNEHDELQIYEIPINEITEIVLESQGDSLNNSVYKVSTDDPDRWIKLFLSVEQKGDQKFVAALHDSLRR